jgi:hypothetical protein
MDIQLMITTDTQPISPVKKMTSTTRVAKTINELTMAPCNQYPFRIRLKARAFPEANGSIGENGRRD